MIYGLGAIDRGRPAVKAFPQKPRGGPKGIEHNAAKCRVPKGELCSAKLKVLGDEEIDHKCARHYHEGTGCARQSASFDGGQFGRAVPDR